MLPTLQHTFCLLLFSGEAWDILLRQSRLAQFWQHFHAKALLLVIPTELKILWQDPTELEIFWQDFHAKALLFGHSYRTRNILTIFIHKFVERLFNACREAFDSVEPLHGLEISSIHLFSETSTLTKSLVQKLCRMTLTLTKLKIKAQKQLQQLNRDIQLHGHQFCLTKLFWKTLITLLQAL